MPISHCDFRRHMERLRDAVNTICVATVMVAGVSSPAWAARNFTPQAGTWIVSSELDGKPGRGLAIDVQGNRFFMQVYGYEQSGEASFYTATGHLDGNSVTAPLLRWRGGRSFGSDARDAVADGSPGDVTVSFSNGLQGVVQLPGEAAVPIERFLVTKRDDPYYQQPAWAQQYLTRFQHWFTYGPDGKISDGWIVAQQGAEGQLLSIRALGSAVTGYLHCSKPPGSELVVCQLADPPGNVEQPVKHAEFRMVGTQVTGSITLHTRDVKPQPFMGVQTHVAQYHRDVNGQVSCRYVESAVVDLLGNCGVPQHMPVNGTWIVAEELTGKPGRGVSLDVQGNQVVMQVFAYRDSGAPGFYMGSGPYAGGLFAPADQPQSPSQAAIPLHRYAGGRSLGGPPQSAVAEEDAGVATIAFSQNDQPALASGTIQFPGEGPKRLIRLPLTDLDSLTDRMLGQWQFMVSLNGTLQPQLVALTRFDGSVVSNDDGSVRCTQADSNQVLCNWYLAGQSQAAGTVLVPAYAAFHLDSRALRLSDQFGNLLGLGDAPMR